MQSWHEPNGTPRVHAGPAEGPSCSARGQVPSSSRFYGLTHGFALKGTVLPAPVKEPAFCPVSTVFAGGRGTAETPAEVKGVTAAMPWWPHQPWTTVGLAKRFRSGAGRWQPGGPGASRASAPRPPGTCLKRRT